MRTRRISNPEACPRVRRTWAPRGQTPTLVTRFARTPRLGGPSCRNDPGTPAGHTGTDPPGRRNCMHPEPQSMNHRTRGRWITAGATAMALLAASCAGTSGSSASGGAATTSSAQAPVVTTQAPKPLQQPGARCGAPRTKATLVRFQAADGTSLDGVMVGSGTTGVVLAHEYLADLCGAWPFADYLAKRGLRAFAVDLRCFGLSSCPQGDAKGRVVDDVVAAVAEFRRRGATKVALVGASMGGSAVLIAGTRVHPPVDAVVELSGQADPTSQLGGIPLNAGAAVAQLAVPTMFMVANNDAYTTVEETRAMHQAAKAGDKRLEVLSGEFDGRHGWGLLTDVGKGGFSSAATTVTEF